MAEKKTAVIRDWVEPAHPMVVKYHDDLVSIFKLLRDQYLEKIDHVFDKVSREIGFLITTTLPLTIEFEEPGKVKSIAIGSENLKGTLFEKQFSPLLKEMSRKDSGFSSSISPGTYDIHLIWFSALKLKFRTDWIEPAHFNDYIKIRERFSKFLRFDWVEPAHVALGVGSFTAVDPNVMEPAHLMPSQELWRDKVLVAAIDQVYPEFRLIERIGKLKELLRTQVRPEVTEPAHFSHIQRELPREALAEIDAILARYGYK
jgi:hypothetical protein